MNSSVEMKEKKKNSVNMQKRRGCVIIVPVLMPLGDGNRKCCC